MQNCANYRGMKLISKRMQFWERVIERRLRNEIKVSDSQFGFMPETSIMEAIDL